MSNIEIEIQVRIANIDVFLKFLKENAEFTGEKYQKDEYFTPQHRNFVEVKPIEEWLRLRESKNNSVTYKKWHYTAEGKSNYCDEYETAIDDAGQLRKIFEALDFKPAITVEKKRKNWIYKDYEISVDEVTDLGEFVEVEYKGLAKNPDPDLIVKEMANFLRSAGCEKIERNFIGYPYMILFPEQTKFEEI